MPNYDSIKVGLKIAILPSIKINQTPDMAKSILDRLNANLEFLKSHIKRIDLINIENKSLQEQLNKLLVA